MADCANTSAEVVRPLVPFLKWAGGKRWLIRIAEGIFPSAIRGTYYEPFLGGASVFSSIVPSMATLSDKNGELINVYRQIKNHWKVIASGLEEMQKKHSHDYYYQIRGEETRDPIRRALKFIYLNRTCYNGLYRVNREGQFNVPIGTKSSVVLASDDFRGWSRALRATQLVESDFEKIIDSASEGDLVFADPPYTVLHNQNCFLKYNEVLFSWTDQVRLADALKRADGRGATIIATNANHKSVRELYKDRFSIWNISRASTIAAQAGKRGLYEEIVIRSRGAFR
jgi:DNA adenine methylase